jgi:hypothetical protein
MISAYEFNLFRLPRFATPPQLTADCWSSPSREHRKWVWVQRAALEDWEYVWLVWMGPEGVKQVTDGDVGQRVMFYRVLVE